MTSQLGFGRLGIGCFAPSLRGVGERSADDGADIRLSDHIDEVVELVLHETLDRIVLVGFSYGGFVITGVADRVGSRAFG
jgi:pimeloyl-ACP methyl ester carboxylesterase